MDNSHYSSNVVSNTSVSTYSSAVGVNGVNGVNGINSSLPPQSLPPLQPQIPAMQSLYGSHPHTPRTPGTPNTPGSNGVSTYPPTSQPAASRGPYQMMSTNPYQPQSYATSSSMLPQSVAAVSHPQPIAPAPATARPSPVGAPALRPLAAGGVMPQSSMGYGQGPLTGQPSLLPDGEQPTHVVGSQGRRGILPSAPGRPQPPPAGTASAKNTVPVKDADGKYPCPHCTKTYLHAKHLKRHLLRHTGDRPYMCVLCRDTFSRSDILKRHFQKCSIRRGNPTGASHLSHPMSHVKNQKALIEKTMRENPPQPIDPTQINGLLRDDNAVHPFDQAMIATDPNRDRRQYSSDVPTTMTPTMSSQMAPYSMPQGQNGVPIFAGSNSNQQSGLDWAQMFPAEPERNETRA